MTSLVKTMPSDKIAEQFVLGAMLNSINAVNDCIPKLDSQDFYYSENQAIFQAICSLYALNHNICGTNVLQELKANKTVSMAYVMGIEMEGALIEWNYYLKIVINESKLRKIIQASQEAVNESKKEDADSDVVIAQLQNHLFQAQGLALKEKENLKEIMEDFSQGRSFHDHTLWAFDEVRAGRMPYTGIASGFPILDKTLGFFRPGCYYTIGARTSMGKTTFLLNLIRNMNFLGRRTSIGFFSLEMPATIIAAKLICMFSQIKYSAFDDARCTASELESVLSWGKSMQDMPIFIEDQSGITISQLRARAKRMLHNHKIEILFIDYLTLIKPDNKHINNHLAVNEVSKGVQQLAKELNIPIVVLAQLNRAVTGRTNNKPTLADFRESGSIEEDSDACLLLHRPEYYDPNEKPGIAQVIVAKNRLRGQLSQIEFHVPYGEVYQELGTVKEQVEQVANDSFRDFYNKDN